MLTSLKRITLLTLCAGLWACDSEPGKVPASDGAPAQVRVDGFIEGTLNGEPRKWYITSGEVNGVPTSQSGWEAFAGMTQVTLFGHTRPDTLLTSKEALMISISLSGIDGSAQLVDSEVVYLSGGITAGYGSNEEGGSAQMVLDTIQRDDGVLRISGQVDAQIYFRVLSRSRDMPEQEESMELEEGRFEAAVRMRN